MRLVGMTVLKTAETAMTAANLDMEPATTADTKAKADCLAADKHY